MRLALIVAVACSAPAPVPPPTSAPSVPPEPMAVTANDRTPFDRGAGPVERDASVVESFGRCSDGALPPCVPLDAPPPPPPPVFGNIVKIDTDADNHTMLDIDVGTDQGITMKWNAWLVQGDREVIGGHLTIRRIDSKSTTASLYRAKENFKRDMRVRFTPPDD